MSDDAFDLLELQLRDAVRRRTPPPVARGARHQALLPVLSVLALAAGAAGFFVVAL